MITLPSAASHGMLWVQGPASGVGRRRPPTAAELRRTPRPSGVATPRNGRPLRFATVTYSRAGRELCRGVRMAVPLCMHTRVRLQLRRTRRDWCPAKTLTEARGRCPAANLRRDQLPRYVMLETIRCAVTHTTARGPPPGRERQRPASPRPKHIPCSGCRVANNTTKAAPVLGGFGRSGPCRRRRMPGSRTHEHDRATM